jgi:hypothetical protein
MESSGAGEGERDRGRRDWWDWRWEMGGWIGGEKVGLLVEEEES